MTATLNGMNVPSWASHVEDKLAPMPLLLVQAYVDTEDRDLGTDILAHRDEARAWLADAGLRVPHAGGADAGGADAGGADRGGPDPERADAGFAGDLRLAREVRASLRALIGHDRDDEPLTADDLAPLEQVLGRAQPRLEADPDGRVRLGPDRPARTLTDGLLGLLLIVRDAQADGTWDRLKLCGNPDCRWAFYDRSHSRRGAWCDMASCGNRVKNRNLRARRAQAS
jgi:CGNR zinc finger/Putative stress-induced transcription regulator